MYTGRMFKSDEAKEIGLVSHVLKNKDEMIEYLKKMAINISSKSPVINNFFKKKNK